MKKLLFFTVIAILGFNTANAQDDTNTSASSVMEMAKGGGFYAGANIGLPLSSSSDVSSFNFGVDVAYLFEVIDNLEVGGLLGYTQFVADGDYSYTDFNNGGIVVRDYKDASFIPVAATARYYFADDKFFAGIDLGVGINVSGDAKTGLYARPKFGFDLGVVALIASFQSISGGTDYNNLNDGNNNNNVYKVSGFNSVNFGVEFGF